MAQGPTVVVRGKGRNGVAWRDEKKKRKRMRKVRSGGDPTEKRKEKKQVCGVMKKRRERE